MELPCPNSLKEDESFEVFSDDCLLCTYSQNKCIIRKLIEFIKIDERNIAKLIQMHGREHQEYDELFKE